MQFLVDYYLWLCYFDFGILIGDTIDLSESIGGSNDASKLKYESNPKHKLGGQGNRSNAGIEPPNAEELFRHSVKSSDPIRRRFNLPSKGW